MIYPDFMEIWVNLENGDANHEANFKFNSELGTGF